ncbi:MAG: hypothetical protein WD355_02135 [Balneolaceae bacterium]
MIHRFNILSVTLMALILLLLSGCSLDTEFGPDQTGQLAAGEVNAQFLDGPMGTPITDTSVHVLARNANQTEAASQGQPLTTDETGSFTGYIQRPERATIVEFVFEFEHNGETYSESVEEVLELKFGDDDEIDSVNIRVHINQDEE